MFAVLGIVLFTAAACNSNSTVEDKTDSVTKINGNDTINQSIWGEPDDLNKDTVPQPGNGN